jgi:Uma2 family endonuclease
VPLSASSREPPITMAVFEKLPEEGAYRIELVRGRLVRSPRPAMLHGHIQLKLGARMLAHVERHGLGVVGSDMGVVTERNPDTVRGPDLAFYSKRRIPEHGYAVTFWGAPDLAVEIVSPSERPREIAEKVREYLAAGTLQVWVVDPRDHTVIVHETISPAPRVFAAGDLLDGGNVLPGFRLAVSDLFAL